MVQGIGLYIPLRPLMIIVKGTVLEAAGQAASVRRFPSIEGYDMKQSSSDLGGMQLNVSRRERALDLVHSHVMQRT